MAGIEFTEERWVNALWELDLKEVHYADGTELVTYPEGWQTQFNYSNKREKENLYYFFRGMLLQKSLEQ